MAYGIKLNISSPFACFTRPEMRVERVSYDVITPSAARGILEAIYWKPQICWVIDRIHILKPIRFTNTRRFSPNESTFPTVFLPNTGIATSSTSTIMYLLVTYDVNTTTPAGRCRLRRPAKACLDFGQRVQNSVFECKIDPAQSVALKARLLEIINPETDSLRFYHLGTNWQHRVEHHGADPGYNIEGPLVV